MLTRMAKSTELNWQPDSRRWRLAWVQAPVDQVVEAQVVAGQVAVQVLRRIKAKG